MDSIGTIKKDKYIIRDIIGKGGFSCVYLVEDKSIGRKWAMKKIYKSDGLALTLAKKEIDMLSDIDYKMIPRITDAWQEEDAIYIVSDYVEGVPLSRILTKRQISMGKTINWCMQVADALRYLHSLDPPILYLDLKPENIIVKANDSLALIDFGIAGRGSGNRLVAGTPGYAAPEQFDDKAEVREQTDIYAFGMLYYYLRTGRPPDCNPDWVRRDITESRVLKSKEKTFLYRCISNSIDRRFSSMEEVIYNLNHITNKSIGLHKVLASAGFIILALSLLITVTQIIAAKESDRAVRDNILADAEKYIVDGEYTKEGLKLLTTFINSGCLDECTSQYYIWEVAMNYFEVQKDYRTAYRYFDRLDENIYPEVAYLKKICEMQSGFDCGSEEYEDCISMFYGRIASERMSKHKAESLLFVSYCFEEGDRNSIEGIKKAITVLEAGVTELKKLGDDDLFDKNDFDPDEMIKKYKRRLDNLYIKAKAADIG